MYVGNVMIPYVNELSPYNISKDVSITKTLNNNLLLNSENINAQNFTLSGVMINTSDREIENFTDDIEAITNRNTSYNLVEFEDVNGFLNIDSSNVPWKADKSNMRNYDLSGSFFPLSKYQRGYQINLDYISNDYNINYPAIIALPVYAYNVYVKTAWDTIKLSPIGYMSGIDGNMPLYSPFPAFDELNYDVTTTGEMVYDESVHGCNTLNIDVQNEIIVWKSHIGVDMPKGVYKLVSRIQESHGDIVADDIEISIIASDSSVIYSETTSTGNTMWNMLETSNFQLQDNEIVTIQIKKLTTNTNEIEVDYCFLLPDTIATLLFDCDIKVDNGDIKVYDTCGSEHETDYRKVNTGNHIFADNSTIIIQNSQFKWEVDLSKFWDETGYFTRLIDDEIGRLYPIAFGNNEVVYKFIQIQPDIVELNVYLSSGESDYDADDAQEIANIKFKRTEIIFTLERHGEFNGDWIVEWDTDNYIGSYCPVANFVSPTGSNINYMSANGIYVSIFDNVLFVFSKSLEANSIMTNTGGYYSLEANTADDYSFVISAVYGFKGDEFLGKIDDLQYSTDPNLELETLTSSNIYDATMWTPDISTPGGSTWAWVTDHLNISSGAADTEAVKILKSYEYGNIDLFKVDFKINDINAVDRYAGIYAYYIDSNYYMRFAAEIKADGTTRIYADYKWDSSHTELWYPCPPCNISTGTKYTFEIEQYYVTNTPTTLYQYITDVYIYTSGTSKPSLPTRTLYHDTDHLYEGNIGLFAKASTVNNIDVDFSDLSIVGKNIWNRGILKNTIYDDLNWDTTAEIIINEGTIGNWTNNTTDLCLDVDSALNLKETFTIDNIILGNGGFRTQVRIDSANSVKRDAGIIFASTDGGVATYYSLVISLELDDTAYLRLMKYGSAAGTAGAYGVGGYGIYGYGGVGDEVILAEQLISYSVGEWYNIECEFDRNAHTFDCYYWEKGSDKPSVTMTYSGDTYYNIGNVGLTAKTDATATGNINASFKNLCVTNAEEANALNGTFLSGGGIPHGSRYYETENITCLNGLLEDLEYAKYNLFTNTKITNGTTDAGKMRFINTTDDTTLSLESANKEENITAVNAWTIQNELIEINDDDEGDTGFIGINQITTGHTDPLFMIDFISVIPIGRNNESRFIYPYDIGFNVYNNNTYNQQIEKREFSKVLTTRLDSDYVEM